MQNTPTPPTPYVQADADDLYTPSARDRAIDRPAAARRAFRADRSR